MQLARASVFTFSGLDQRVAPSTASLGLEWRVATCYQVLGASKTFGANRASEIPIWEQSAGRVLAQPWICRDSHLFLKQAWIQVKIRKVRVCNLFILNRTLTDAAETAILREEKKPGFSVSLLQIVASDAYSSTARLASALYFKNFIRRNWTVRLSSSDPHGCQDANARLG